jgi:hypothetical protein
MIEVTIEFPDRLVNLYDADNDTELTNQEYFIAEVQRIAFEAIDRKIKDVHNQSAEILTKAEKT